MAPQNVPPELRAEVLVGGPDVCVICGRTFTRGGMFHDSVTSASGTFCMWCIAGWLEDVTGWAIVDQMRGWLVSKRGGRPSTWTAYSPQVDASPDLEAPDPP